MKKVLVLAVILGFLWGTYAFASGEGCPLTGNTYTLEMDNITYELSGFDCTFGPGCQADCDLWYGDFELGPKHYMSLPFVCEPTGDVIIAGIPCALDSHGNLACLAVDVSGYTCIKLGTRTWCLSEKPGEFQFDLAN